MQDQFPLLRQIEYLPLGVYTPQRGLRAGRCFIDRPTRANLRQSNLFGLGELTRFGHYGNDGLSLAM